MEQVVGVSHECDFPEEAKARPRVTHCPVHNAGLASGEVDQWVRRALRDNGTIYTIDEPLLRELRPDVILTQKLCDVCAVGYGTVARLAETLPGPPQVVNLEPTSLTDIFDDIRRVADACGVPERARSLIARLSERVESRAAPSGSHFASTTLFSDGVGGAAVLLGSLGTGARGDRRRLRFVRPNASALGASRLAGSNRRVVPKFIVLALCGYDIDHARRDYELLRSFPDFDSLPAAHRGEIYLVNASAYFARPGPRIVDSLEILAGILHPREFPEFASTRA